MTRLALISLETNEVLEVLPPDAQRLKLPSGSWVSPPIAGWKGGGKLITTEGPPRFALVKVRAAPKPKKGKRHVGAARYAYDGKQVVEEIDVEDEPPPAPEPSREEKFNRMLRVHGLTADDVRSILAEPPAKPK